MTDITWPDVQAGMVLIGSDEKLTSNALKLSKVLARCKLPPCSIWTHGPGSIVMSWTIRDVLISITVSSKNISLLMSDAEEIFFRTKLPSDILKAFQ